MRVTFLTTSYPRGPGDPSGHFVRAEARARAAAGDEVHVIAPRPFADDAGVVAHAAGGDALFAWPGAVARVTAAPWRLTELAPFTTGAVTFLRRLRPDLLIAHWLVPNAIPLGRLGAPAARCEVVCHGADVRLLLRAPAPLRALALSSLVTHGATFRFVAEELRLSLLASLPTALAREVAARSGVAPPAVDVDDRVPGPAPDGPYVVCAGRLVRAKRVDVAIAAIAACPPPLRLVVVGDGPERNALAALAARIAPDRVTFAGRLPRPEALGLVAGACALIHPSEVEAAPTTVLEAIALGVPVVACPSGDLARWAAEGRPLRVVDRDPRALALALLDVLA